MIEQTYIDSTMKIVRSFRAAVDREENWTDDGINWNFVDADMYMEVKPMNSKEQEKYLRMFNDMADNFEQRVKFKDFDEYKAWDEKITKEYEELFGLAG